MVFKTEFIYSISKTTNTVKFRIEAASISTICIRESAFFAGPGFYRSMSSGSFLCYSVMAVRLTLLVRNNCFRKKYLMLVGESAKQLLAYILGLQYGRPDTLFASLLTDQRKIITLVNADQARDPRQDCQINQGPVVYSNSVSCVRAFRLTGVVRLDSRLWSVLP